MSGPADGGGYTLGKQALTQIGEVVRAFNSGGGARPTNKSHYRPTFGSGFMDGVTTTAITPATVANNGQKTYGTGSALILLPTASNNGSVVSKNDPSYNGPQIIINPYTNNGNSFPSNTQVTLGWRGGFIEIIGADQC
jgi:hypothetical protein